MKLTFRTRMLPAAILTSVMIGFWMTSPAACVINFSAWWLIVFSVEEICAAIRADIKTER